MEIVTKVENTKVENMVGRILSKIVGAELSAEELNQVSGGSKECTVWTGASREGWCDD
jgi:bacteriocin-like protein